MGLMPCKKIVPITDDFDSPFTRGPGIAGFKSAQKRAKDRVGWFGRVKGPIDSGRRKLDPETERLLRGAPTKFTIVIALALFVAGCLWGLYSLWLGLTQ